MKFLGRDQKTHFAYTTSWGVSTRLIGAIIMAHSDDEGSVLLPRPPTVVAVVPIFKTDAEGAVADFTGKVVGRPGRAEEVPPRREASPDEIRSYFFDKPTGQRSWSTGATRGRATNNITGSSAACRTAWR